MQPKDPKLYARVKQLANKKFLSKSGVHRSSWIIREYKKRGGKFIGKRGSALKRWYGENWVDLNSPIKRNGRTVGYKKCGSSKGKKYPLCRPTKRLSPSTPRTVKELSKKEVSKAKKDKSRIRHTGNIKFGGAPEKINVLAFLTIAASVFFTFK
ncbi:hypothetical protein EB118_02060 [bacterium]|nr:hypothetical protein [bacterium]NDC93894.1 hypothetical protein [bacterium]NDD83272.1 hypothetical protein [bacterium]NDG28872.1 hypothetical protein [bacterium]